MALLRRIFTFAAFFLACAFVFGGCVAGETQEQLEHRVPESVALDSDSEEAIEIRDSGYYPCNCYAGRCNSICYRRDLSTGAIIGIILSSLLFIVAITVLFCYICACGCFKGRRQRRTGQVYTAQVVQANQRHPQPPPGYFYGPQPAAAPGVSIVHSHQAGAAAYPPAAGSQPGVYYNNGFQVAKTDPVTARY